MVCLNQIGIWNKNKNSRIENKKKLAKLSKLLIQKFFPKKINLCLIIILPTAWSWYPQWHFWILKESLITSWFWLFLFSHWLNWSRDFRLYHLTTIVHCHWLYSILVTWFPSVSRDNDTAFHFNFSFTVPLTFFVLDSWDVASVFIVIFSCQKN